MPASDPGLTESEAEIFKNVAKLLISLDMEDDLGIRHLEGRDPDRRVEVTENQAKIMLPGRVRAREIFPGM